MDLTAGAPRGAAPLARICTLCWHTWTHKHSYVLSEMSCCRSGAVLHRQDAEGGPRHEGPAA